MAVCPLGGHRLHLRFEDGMEGDVDLAPLLAGFPGVFAPLRDPAEFAKVELWTEAGTVRWPNGADIAPETLYALATGRT
ncbi:MAG: DUF2442 domain-containing protein [Myxococcales bacterium]